MARLWLSGATPRRRRCSRTPSPSWKSSRQPDDPCLAIALTNLAEAYRIDGRYAKAEPYYRQVLAIVRENPEQKNAEIVEGLNHFTAMLRKTKRKAEARDLDNQIQSILPKP